MSVLAADPAGTRVRWNLTATLIRDEAAAVENVLARVNCSCGCLTPCRRCRSWKELQVIPPVSGRVHQKGPSEVERHTDCQCERSESLLAECGGDHEHECRDQADRGEDVLCGGKILSAAGWSPLVLAGQPVRDSGNEKRESGTSEERQGTEEAEDARHRTRESASRERKLNEPVLCIGQLLSQLPGRLLAPGGGWRRAGTAWLRGFVGSSRPESPRVMRGTTVFRRSLPPLPLQVAQSAW
jgi:hypothetical protein